MKKFCLALAGLVAMSGHGMAASAINLDSEPRTLIVTEGGDKSEIAIGAGETGLVVDGPGSVDELTAALGDLLGDEPRRRAMGEAGRRRAVTDFSYDVLAARLQAGLDAWAAR